MKDILTLTGQDALTLGSASHRQPEVLNGDHWRTAAGLPEAARYLHDDPTTIRLRAPTRVLVEGILKIALQPDADVNGAIDAARRNTLHPLTSVQRLALDIIQREITP